MSSFKIAIVAFFLVFGIVAVMIFAGIIPIGSSTGPSTATGNVVMWGTVKQSSISKLLDDFARNNKAFTLTYVEKTDADLDQSLIEALASGKGPDMIFLPDNLIIKHRDKIYPIPYTSIPQGTFQSTFIDEASLYLTDQGILALPITIDPMVMYYNKSMFNEAGISLPPRTWDDVVSLVPKLTQKDNASNINVAGIPFGSYNNVNHAKDLMAMLMLQSGNPIISQKNGGYISNISDSSIGNTQASMNFYSQFSNPLNNLYSWNASLPNSRDAFTSSQLAIYFGYASELFGIRAQNPNLDFDVAKMPQLTGTNKSLTFGRMYGIALLKSSKNLTTAYTATTILAGADFSGNLANTLSLPSPRRDLLAVKAISSYGPVFNNSALISESWLDPDRGASNAVFRDIIDGINRGDSLNTVLGNANNVLGQIVAQHSVAPQAPAQ